MSGPERQRAPRILVLMGGPDAERAVSINSGIAVAGALRETGRYEVFEEVIDRVDAEPLRAWARERGLDAVFPALHGAWGEGGPLQEVLEQSGLAYVGSPPAAAALAMDKMRTKTLLAEAGVATPPACVLEPGEACPLAPPLVLKPVDDGSSVDLRIARTAAEIDAARGALHPKRGRLLAERYIDGRELTVGIVAGAALPLIEIRPAVEFYDYEAKYEREDTRYLLEPDVPPEAARACRDAALLAYERLGCRDLARADFMLDEQGPWFLEINTMPGFTSHSLVPMAAAHEGVTMPALCARLVDAALARVTVRSR